MVHAPFALPNDLDQPIEIEQSVNALHQQLKDNHPAKSPLRRVVFHSPPLRNFRTVYGNTEKHMAQTAQPLYSQPR
jgi:hypothetical protein